MYKLDGNCHTRFRNKIGGCVFNGCKSRVDITLPNSINRIGSNAFNECCGLKKMIIPDSEVEIEQWAFGRYRDLTEIFIPNSITRVDEYAFYGCIFLAKIVLSNSLIDVAEDAFTNCAGLKEITILCPISLKRILPGCTSLKRMTLGVGIKGFSKDFFDGWSGNLEVINVPANKTEYYKKRIPEHFHGIIKELPAEKKPRKKI